MVVKFSLGTYHTYVTHARVPCMHLTHSLSLETHDARVLPMESETLVAAVTSSSASSSGAGMACRNTQPIQQHAARLPLSISGVRYVIAR